MYLSFKCPGKDQWGGSVTVYCCFISDFFSVDRGGDRPWGQQCKHGCTATGHAGCPVSGWVWAETVCGRPCQDGSRLVVM